MTKYFSHKYEEGYVEVGHKRQLMPIKLYYEMHGHGSEKVVLITGLSSPCSSWDNQTKFLAESGNYTVLVFDNRGMGYSDSPIGLYSTSQMAQDALDLLNHFGWYKNIHLVGMSLGGMISLEMVDADIQRFQSLTLTSTASRRSVPTWNAISSLSKIFFIKEPLDQLNAGIDVIYPKDWLAQKPEKSTEYATNREMAAQQYIRNLSRSREQPSQGFLGQTSACMRHYFSDERLERIQSSDIAVMIVTGTSDNLVRPFYSYQMKQVLQSARFEIFEGSGHSLPDEKPDRYNSLLIDHFNSSTVERKCSAL